MKDPRAGGNADEHHIFLVTFDLAERDGEAHERLVEILESYPDHARLWPSTWVIKSSETAGDVLEALDWHLTLPDRVFVAAIAGDCGWRNVECDFDWLRENLEGLPREG
jgi:hypothetical protein